MFWQKWILLGLNKKSTGFWIFEMLLCWPIANAIFSAVKVEEHL
jgi:hypothetical protein